MKPKLVTAEDERIYRAGLTARNRHYERQTERVARWESMIDRKMQQKRPSLKHSTDAPGLWGKK